jgi:3-phenylpropionate/trans-cinnamate dioxygenase ferredoxin reductase subunit
MIKAKPVAVDKIVILGGGHSGVHVATSLRTHGYTGHIVVVEESLHTPYERPPLSKEILNLSSDDRATPLRKSDFYDSKDVQLVSGVSAEFIDREDRSVTLGDGSKLEYDCLVLATGSIASTVRVPGASLAGVLTLKTYDDAMTIRQHLKSQGRIVVVGAGYIGLEVAAAAAKASCQVTVLEFQDRVMKRVTSPPVSKFFQELHAAHGVDVRVGALLKSIEGDSTVRAVLTEDGQRFDANLVVTGVGVKPNQDIALKAGILCEDGVLVDKDGRTSDPAVYACGDVTRTHDPLVNQSTRLECVSHALSQGNRVARAIMALSPPNHEVPWFWTVQYGQRLQTAGVQFPTDETVIRGIPGSGKFSVLYLRDGVLAALDTINRLSDFIPGKRLIAGKAKIDSSIAKNPNLRLIEAVIERV